MIPPSLKNAIGTAAVMIIVLVFVIYEYSLRIMPTPLAADWLDSLGTHAAQLTQLNRFYFLVYISLQIPVGMCIDQRGPKPLLIAASTCCAAGCALLALALHHHWMLPARLLIGVGTTTATLCCLRLAINWLPLHWFGSICGLVTAIGMACTLQGHQIIQSIASPHWRLWLLQMSTMGLVIALLTYIFVSNTPANQRQHQSSTTKLSFRHLLTILYTPTVWICGMAIGLSFIPFSALGLQWGIPYLETIHHLNKHHATLLSRLILAGGVIGCMCFGLLSDLSRNRKKSYLVGILLALMTMACMVFLPNPSNFSIGIVWFALGLFCACGVLSFAVAKETMPLSMSATTLAVVNTIMLSIGAASQWIMVYLLALFRKQMWYVADDYQKLFLLLPFGLIITLIMVLFIKESHASQQPEYSQAAVKPHWHHD